MCTLIINFSYFCSIAVVNILPPLYELANNLASNFQSWSEKRKLELRGENTSSTVDGTTTTGGQMAARPSVVTSSAATNASTANLKPEIVDELRKVDERVSKFRDKITALKLPEADRTKKRRSSFRTNISG